MGGYLAYRMRLPDRRLRALPTMRAGVPAEWHGAGRRSSAAIFSSTSSRLAKQKIDQIPVREDSVRTSARSGFWITEEARRIDRGKRQRGVELWFCKAGADKKSSHVVDSIESRAEDSPKAGAFRMLSPDA